MLPRRPRWAASSFAAGAIVLVLALVPVGPAQPEAPAVRVTQVTVKIFGHTVQVAVVGTGPLTYRTLQLSSPPRLVIDLPGAIVDAAIPPVIDVEKGAVDRVRVGQFQDRPPVARVAVDMRAPLSFRLATTAPNVLVAQFASHSVAAVPAPAAAPTAPAPAPVAQAPADPPAPPPVPVAQTTPAAPPLAPGRITLEFRATELADVLSALARVCNVNIVTDASVKGTVTVRLIDLSCEEALRFILEANNLGFRRVGRNLIIMAADRLAPPPEAPEAITYPIGFGVAKDVADAIRAAVPGIRVTSDARSNAVVVVGTQAQHEEVRKILAGLDVQLPQVMIETRVVDIGMETLNQLGLRWGLTGDPPVNVIQVRGTFPGLVRVGYGDFTINAALEALVRDGKARVLTAPRVAVVDGNEASVNLGEELPIPSVDATGRVTFTFKPVGVILRITPKVNRDGLVTTKVEPEISAVREILQNQVPRLTSRKASTTVTVRSGESIVLAGLISSEERRTTVKVPILGDIPILGVLFRVSTTSRTDNEVIFVVTPLILPGPGAPAPAPSPQR
ncbi:MAG: AMIN domain-containing protein [Armatimonadota bacterium]|nr:AMIN domain-containing protein [Armatimonadota bacterium]